MAIKVFVYTSTQAQAILLTQRVYVLNTLFVSCMFSRKINIYERQDICDKNACKNKCSFGCCTTENNTKIRTDPKTRLFLFSTNKNYYRSKLN
jgi:hypothetical protein